MGHNQRYAPNSVRRRQCPEPSRCSPTLAPFREEGKERTARHCPRDTNNLGTELAMKAMRQARLELSGGSTPDQLKPLYTTRDALPPAGSPHVRPPHPPCALRRSRSCSPSPWQSARSPPRQRRWTAPAPPRTSCTCPRRRPWPRTSCAPLGTSCRRSGSTFSRPTTGTCRIASGRTCATPRPSC